MDPNLANYNNENRGLASSVLKPDQPEIEIRRPLFKSFHLISENFKCEGCQFVNYIYVAIWQNECTGVQQNLYCTGFYGGDKHLKALVIVPYTKESGCTRL